MYSYYTKLDVEECKKRIDKAIDRDWLNRERLIGKVNMKKNKFRLLKLKAYSSNSFARIFYGRLIEQENGTIIQGKFRRKLYPKIFMTFWLAGLTFISSQIFFAFFFNIFSKKSIGGNHLLLGVVVSLLMYTGAILGIKSGVWLRKNQEKYVLDFIKNTLESEEFEISSSPIKGGGSIL